MPRALILLCLFLFGLPARRPAAPRALRRAPDRARRPPAFDPARISRRGHRQHHDHRAERGVVVIDSGLTRADGRRAVDFIRSITRLPVTGVGLHPLAQRSSAGRLGDPRRLAAASGSSPPPRRRERSGGRMRRYISTAARRADRNPLPQSGGGHARHGRGAAAQSAARRGDPRALGADGARHAAADGRHPRHLSRPADRDLHRELLLDDPVRPVRLIHPGRANTDGDAIAWLPNERIVVTGDIVVSSAPVRLLQLPRRLARRCSIGSGRSTSRSSIPGHGEPQTDTRLSRPARPRR